MAGAGKKTFVAGEVLTAAQVNDYLMDQAVMRFSGSAARAASITAPTEGMVTYLDDANRIEVYDGSAWLTVADAGLVTAKGDLIAATGSAAITNIGVGTDGQFLSASSGAPSGLAWVPSPGGGIASDEILSGATWVAPGGVTTALMVICVAGGGGGGSGGRGATSPLTRASGGGGGGAGAVSVFHNVPLSSASVSISIGAGGSGGAARASGTGIGDGSAGTNGSNTWFQTASLFYAGGGGGGGAGRGSNTNSTAGAGGFNPNSGTNAGAGGIGRRSAYTGVDGTRIAIWSYDPIFSSGGGGGSGIDNEYTVKYGRHGNAGTSAAGGTGGAAGSQATVDPGGSDGESATDLGCGGGGGAGHSDNTIGTGAGGNAGNGKMVVYYVG